MTPIRFRLALPSARWAAALSAALLAAGCAASNTAAPLAETLAQPVEAPTPPVEAELEEQPVNLAALGLRGASPSSAGGAEPVSAARPAPNAQFDGGSRVGEPPQDPDGLNAMLNAISTPKATQAQATETLQLEAPSQDVAAVALAPRLWPEADVALVQAADIPAEPVRLAAAAPAAVPVSFDFAALLPTAAAPSLPQELTAPATPALEAEPILAVAEPAPEPEPAVMTEEPIAAPVQVAALDVAPAQAAHVASVEEPAAAVSATREAGSWGPTLEQLITCAPGTPRRLGSVTKITCR